MKMKVPQGGYANIDQLPASEDLYALAIERADFSQGFDFTNADMCKFSACVFRQTVRGVCFCDAVFTSCDFSNVCFEECGFIRSSFADCKLTRAGFSSCHFDCTEFCRDNADYLGLFACKLKNVLFSECRTEHCRFENCFQRNLRLRQTDLARGEISGTSFDGVDLTSCDISGLRFVGRELAGATVTALQAVQLAAVLGVKII